MHTHNQLAAANLEIKASVTDVISGYICDKQRKRAEESRGEQHAANIHRAANCYRVVQRRGIKRESKRESTGVTHHLLGAYWLCIQRFKRLLILLKILHRRQQKAPLSSNLLREIRKRTEDVRLWGYQSPSPFDVPVFDWKEERDLKKKDVYAFDASRLLVKEPGLWTWLKLN